MKIWIITIFNYNKGTGVESLPKLQPQFSTNWYYKMPDETYPIINCFPRIYKTESSANWAIKNYNASHKENNITLKAFPIDIDLFHGFTWTNKIFFVVTYDVNDDSVSISVDEKAYSNDNDANRKINYVCTNGVFAGYDKVYETCSEYHRCTHLYKDKKHQRKYKLLYVEMPENEIQNIGWVK